MSTQWHPVRAAEAIPDDRVVEVMQRGGRTRLGVRISTRLRLQLKGADGLSAIRISVVVDYLTGDEIIDVVAWRDVPGTEPLPVGEIHQIEERIAA